MRVAMVGFRGIAEEGLGGVEKAVRELSTRLVKRGVEVSCFCRSRYNSLSSFCGVELINTPTLYTKHLETGLYAMTASLQASLKGFDIVHIHALASGFFGWLPRLAQKKVILTIHGLDWQREKWGFGAKTLLKLAESIGVKSSHHVICVSKSLLEYYSKNYPDHPISYIPNGCDLPNRELPPPPPEGLTSRGYFLFLGRIVPEKGVDKLIEAYRQIDTQLPLLIAGSAPHANDYLQTVQELAGKDNRIRLLGAVKGEFKERLLQHAFLFILPSSIEGMPIALLEAGSRSTCPLVSDIAPNREVLGPSPAECGLICRPLDVESIAEQLQAALNQREETMQKGLQFKERVLKEYNWEGICDETLALYQLSTDIS